MIWEKAAGGDLRQDNAHNSRGFLNLTFFNRKKIWLHSNNTSYLPNFVLVYEKLKVYRNKPVGKSCSEGEYSMEYEVFAGQQLLRKPSPTLTLPLIESPLSSKSTRPQ